MQIGQRKAAVGRQQPVREEQRPRRLRDEPDGELARAADPFMRQVLIEEVGEVGRETVAVNRAPS